MEVYEKYGISAYRQDILLRITQEAREQNALLTIKDLVKQLFSNDAGPTSSARSRPIKRHQNMENSYRKRYMLVSRN